MVAADQFQGLISTNIDIEDETDLSDDDEAPEDLTDDPRCPIILLSKEEKEKIRRPWKQALIIKMFDSKIGYMSLMKRLKKKWELKGGLILTDIGYEYFIARFSNVEDYNYVLTQGPWMLDDNYLTIRKWVPNFIPDDSPIRFLTAWVRIPNLAVEYFDKEFLQKIGNKIGKVTRIDHNTALAQRGQFTRLSVELDLNKPLLSKFWLRGRIWKVQYEGLRLICFNCGKIGHLGEECPNSLTTKDIYHEEAMETHATEAIEINKSPVEVQDFGSWMMVKKPPPRRRPPRIDKQGAEAGKTGNTVQQGVNPNPRGNQGGSRFTILEEENQENINDKHGKTLTTGITKGVSNNFETVDLGLSSQPNNTIINPFNIGRNSQNPGFEGNKSGGQKQWKEIRKHKDSAPKSILKNITNALPKDTQKIYTPPTSLGQENTEIIFQASTEDTSKLHHLETNQATSGENSISHVSATPITYSASNPTREGGLRGLSDIGTIFGNSRPPDTQAGSGNSLMEGIELSDARTHDHTKDPQ
ncbi:uncharacterized protein [Spinacia oleracea]|uniref:CCHC-type domain-containing protein n=1 Tax=Spinacia oleracea TaxID=3562 RepID=A0A9R0IHV1_SPIOL|nr:uncharacterized protein LOC110789148 [Spinacia oleracea]